MTDLGQNKIVRIKKDIQIDKAIQQPNIDLNFHENFVGSNFGANPK